MADRSIIVRLRANIEDYQRRMREAAQSTSDWVSRNESSINSLSNTAGLIGAAMVGVAAVAVKKFADFDQAISNVKATGEDAAGSIDKLRQASLDAGARTVFSATEAANAVENLAKAGVSASDILNGGLDGALDLASAGGLAVADAAEIAATALTQFGLKGKDMTHVADILAAGAGKAQGSVSDLGLALSYAGIPAHQLGVSIEETAGTIALFAKNGLIGEKAGTSLRSIIASLTSPSQVAAQAMAELNISMFDGQGKFIGLEGAAGVLQARIGTLSEKERSAALGRIFGNESLQAANLLVAEGAEGVKEWTAAVDDQGFAAEVAATKLDNLRGDWEGFTGALDTAFIGMGEGANGPLRSLTQAATDVVNAFSGLPEGAQSATLAIIGGGGLVLLGIAGLGKLVVAVNSVRTALIEMGAASRVAAIAGAIGTMAGYAVGIGALAVATGMLIDELTTGEAELGANALKQALRELAETGDLKAINEEFDNFGKFAGIARTDVTDLGSALKKVTDQSFDSKSVRAFEWIPGVTSNIEIVEKRFAKLDESLASLASSGHAQEAADAFRQIQKAADEQGISVEQLDKIFPQYQDALIGVQQDATDAAEAQSGMTDALGTTTEAVGMQVESLEDLVKALSDAAGNALSVWDAQAGLEQAYDDATAAVEKNGATLDLTTQAGRDNEAALKAVADSGWELVESMQANGATQEELQAAMTDSRAKFVEVAAAILGSEEAANALADQLGLIPTDIQPKVTITTNADAAQADIDQFIRGNDGRTIHINLRTGENTVSSSTGGGGNYIAHENGALYAFGSGGGIDAAGRHVPRVSQIRPGGATVMWAEPETVWETYISGKPSMRSRNIALWQETGRRLGVTHFADGGVVAAWAAPPAPTPYVFVQHPGGHGTQAVSSGPTVSMGDVTLVSQDPRGGLAEFDRFWRFEMAGRSPT